MKNSKEFFEMLNSEMKIFCHSFLFSNLHSFNIFLLFMVLTQKNVDQHFVISTTETLEIKKIVLGTKNEPVFTQFQQKLFGEAGIESTYGSGPLSYKSKTNLQE